MDIVPVILAALMGLLEGLTEFLPVSSTGHLIIFDALTGFEDPLGVFKVVIQLGAILAICLVFFMRLWNTAKGVMNRDPQALRFALSILLAFLPAALLGVMLHGFIKEVLFSPWVVCATLILGGFAILAIENIPLNPRHQSAEGLPPSMALKIGACQMLALVPGVSRSGATILGAMLLGVERKAATEFSFFLAIPTMLGAAVYDLMKTPTSELDGQMIALIVIGFCMAFIAGLIVVRPFMAFIARYGFTPFAWWRIALGLTMAVVLSLTQAA